MGNTGTGKEIQEEKDWCNMPLTINYLSRICTSKRKTIKDEPGFH